MIEVLLADDHAMIRNGVRHLVEDTEDMRVTGEASHGAGLMDLIRENDYSVAVMDMSMPGRTGLDLLKQIKAERPQLPVLIYTMHQEEQYAVRGIRCGAAGYLTKDCDGDVLLNAIRKVACGGVFITPRVAELLATDVSRPGDAPPHTLLSNREIQIFDRIVRGMSLTAIAEEFSLSVKTISTHKSHIMDKMGIDSQLDLVRYALDHALIGDRPS
jgi:two-component system, NarL family, invasion response regulator UvrY